MQHTIAPRADFLKGAPAALEPLYRAEKILAQSRLEPALITLLQVRASQINGCAFCIALHVREAEELGEGRDRLYGLMAWRDAPWYSDRERAALEWVEAVTRIEGHVSDELYERISAAFTEDELVYLTLAVSTINSWNRFCIAFRVSPDRADEAFQRLSAQRRVGSG